MPAQMLLHEGGYEEVAVVVALLHPQSQRYAGFFASAGKQPGPQLAFQERVGRALVDEDFAQGGAVLDQGDGVVGAPGGAVGAEIAAERLLAPRDLARRDDRGEGGDAPVAAGIAQSEGEGAVAAHRMAGDRLAVHV